MSLTPRPVRRVSVLLLRGGGGGRRRVFVRVELARPEIAERHRVREARLDAREALLRESRAELHVPAKRRAARLDVGEEAVARVAHVGVDVRQALDERTVARDGCLVLARHFPEMHHRGPPTLVRVRGVTRHLASGHL